MLDTAESPLLIESAMQDKFNLCMRTHFDVAVPALDVSREAWTGSLACAAASSTGYLRIWFVYSRQEMLCNLFV